MCYFALFLVKQRWVSGGKRAVLTLGYLLPYQLFMHSV